MFLRQDDAPNLSFSSPYFQFWQPCHVSVKLFATREVVRQKETRAIGQICDMCKNTHIIFFKFECHFPGHTGKSHNDLQQTRRSFRKGDKKATKCEERKTTAFYPFRPLIITRCLLRQDSNDATLAAGSRSTLAM